MWRDRFLDALAAPARNCNTETNAKTPETITVKPLSLDDAISHADEVAGDCSTSCQQAHKQLADWLRELRNRRNGSGNSAALREAASDLASIFDCDIQFLERHAKELRDTGAYGGGIIEHILHSITLARAALAEPPRNCDIYLTEEAVDAATVTVRDCEACSRIDMEAPCVFCMVRWLLAPATEKEGGANG